MTDKLPPNLLALFAPRPALRYLPPSDHAPESRKTPNIGGLVAFLPALQEYAEEVPYKPTESWLQRKDRERQERKEELEYRMTEGVKSYEPASDPQIRGDAFKTLFVGRLAFGTGEGDLEREFGRFGPIERIRIVQDVQEMGEGKKKKKKKKPHRGYAFIVYEREKDMKAAYKETDGIRIKDRRVLVDVERGRTVKGWRPRRFGGGLGGRGYMKAPPARPNGPPGFAAPAGPGGFQGGGFRGGGFGGRGGGGFRGGRGGFGDRGDRGGFGGRGGIGYRGDFGSGGGGRGGFTNGFGNGAPPPNAPSGPGGAGRGGPGFGGHGGGAMNGSAGPEGPGGYGGRPRDEFGDNRGYRGGGGRHSDRGDSRGGVTGSNREPIRVREGFEQPNTYGGGRDAREPGSRDAGRDGQRDPRDRDRERERGGERGGERDRDRYGGGGRRDDEYGSRKRYHEGDGYDDPRSKRRY